MEKEIKKSEDITEFTGRKLHDLLIEFKPEPITLYATREFWEAFDIAVQKFINPTISPFS